MRSTTLPSPYASRLGGLALRAGGLSPGRLAAVEIVRRQLKGYPDEKKRVIIQTRIPLPDEKIIREPFLIIRLGLDFVIMAAV